MLYGDVTVSAPSPVQTLVQGWRWFVAIESSGCGGGGDEAGRVLLLPTDS